MEFPAWLVCLALAFPVTATEAAAAGNDWDRLAQTSKTQKVKVHLLKGKPLSGFIQAVSPTALTLIHRKEVLELPRDNIADVSVTSRWRGALAGAAVGGGLGAGLGAAVTVGILDKNNPSTEERLQCAAIFGSFFGGIGAAIGTAVGWDRTLYRSPAPKKPKRAESFKP